MGGVMLQTKQIAFLWLIIGNGLLIVWALFLYGTGRQPGTLFFRLVVFLQVLVIVSVAAGFGLLSAGVPTTWAHVLYAVLNGGLAVGRVLAHTRLLRLGKRGVLWQIGLAALAIGLIARSSATVRF